MAEGGFDEFEMGERDYQKYSDYTDMMLDTEERRLTQEFDELYEGGRYLEGDNKVKYDSISNEIKLIREERERRFGYKETSFIDDTPDDGKTVTIKGPGNNNTKAERVKFINTINKVPDNFTYIDDNTYNVLRSVGDDADLSNEQVHNDLMDRLKKVGKKNKANIENQLERISAVTKIVQLKNKVNLNPNKPTDREILNRSTVVELKDGIDTLYFKPIGNSGKLLKPVLIMKKGRGGVLQYSGNIRSALAVNQYKELISKLQDDQQIELEPGPELEWEYQTIEEDYFPMVTTDKEPDEIDGLTEKENSELRGVLNPISETQEGRTGNKGALQIQADYIQDNIDNTQQRIRELENINTIEAGEEYIDLQERIQGLRTARDRTLEQRNLEEAREQQEEDINRLVRFKEWVKENWKESVAVTSLLVTISSLITTIIIGSRTAAVKGAKATKSFAEAVRDAIKKLGPWAVPLAALAYFMLNGGSKVLYWLANNLWFVVLLVAAYIYYYYFYQKRK